MTIAVAIRTGSAVVFADDSNLTTAGLVGAKQAKGTSTKARACKQTVTRKAGAAIARAVTTVRKALVGAAMGAAKGAVSGAGHGAMTAVKPEPSLAGTDSPQTSGEQPRGEPGR